MPYGLCRTLMLNPLTPESDWHLISPNSMNTTSHSKVMRIKEMNLSSCRGSLKPSHQYLSQKFTSHDLTIPLKEKVAIKI